jgi:pyruvate/2-oxoglutarate dehydrogenase complex dihydrolipoamide acyltransferase (E2) component
MLSGLCSSLKLEPLSVIIMPEQIIRNLHGARMETSYTELALPRFRQGIIDYLDEAKRNRTIAIVFELDITDIRPAIRRYRRATKSSLSLTTYILWVLARTLNDFKQIQAYRKGKKIIIFDDVDVSTMVERTVEGMVTTTSYVVRKANEKSLQEINDELEEAKFDTAGSAFTQGKRSGKRSMGDLFTLLPRFMRRAVLAYMMRRNPKLRKKLFGTVSFSALQMFSSQKGWGIPITPFALNCLLGGIGKTPAFEKGTVVEREVISATMTMNHDLNDGGPGVRFMVAFLSNLKKCRGLEAYVEKKS